MERTAPEELRLAGPDGVARNLATAIPPERAPRAVCRRASGLLVVWNLITRTIIPVLSLNGPGINQQGIGDVDVFSERIWSGAGMEGDAEMATTPIGEPLNDGVFAARLRDKARFALLFTPSRGTVSDTQVVNDAFFEKVYGTGNSAAFFNPESDMGRRILGDFDDAPTHASYQWDAVFEDGDLYKSGKNGQCIYVSPANDMAVVWFSNTYDN
ncbi:hypothetical protein AB9K41_04970, partial [Cribrihabitans sp. XS_ASV171]